MEYTNKIYAIFHVGRGGRLNNPGHIKFIGEKTIREMELLCDDYLFSSSSIKYNAMLFDGSGNIVGEKGGGVLNFDGDYDTYYARDFDNLTEEELEVIKREGMYISEELRAACGWSRYSVRCAENGAVLEDVDTIDAANVIIAGYIVEGYREAIRLGKIGECVTFEDYEMDNSNLYEIYDNQKFKVVY